jgi:hypothetical protein
MGMNYKEAGGGPATGLADSFINFLQSGLQTGSFGGASAMGQSRSANPFGSTLGISGVLNDILSAGGGRVGGSMADMIRTQQTNDVNSLRARFGVGGGTAFGSPAQYGLPLLGDAFKMAAGGFNKVPNMPSTPGAGGGGMSFPGFGAPTTNDWYTNFMGGGGGGGGGANFGMSPTTSFGFVPTLRYQ